jgi:hypothetical protein
MKLIPIKEGKFQHLSVGRKLLPTQIDVFGRVGARIDIPEVGFDRRAGIKAPRDDL